MLMDIIKERHSIRKYTDEQIGRDDLEKILEAGNFAPNAGGGQRSMMVAIHNKELATYVGKMNMAGFDCSHLAGSFVSKEQPSTIDDPTIKNGFYDAPTVVCVFCQNNFLFKTADAFCMMENMILLLNGIRILIQCGCLMEIRNHTHGNCWIKCIHGGTRPVKYIL